MAHLLPNCSNISKRHYREPAYRNACTKQHRTGWLGITSTDEGRGSWKYAAGHSRRQVKILEKTGSTLQQYCCSSSSSSSSSPTSSAEDVSWLFNGKVELNNNVVSEHGWKVRKLVAEEGEMRKVAQVQAEAFHVPVALFNDFFFQFFQAEVLSGLLYRLRNSPPDRYACLVAEPSSDVLESPKEVVGVVDVTVLRDETVVQHLQGAEEYLYVSGIAVLNNFRRQKVATALLKACDMVSILWGFEYLALRAYEDDWGARQLYTNAGYVVVSGDPPWMTTWIGRKRRLLLIKRSNLQLIANTYMDRLDRQKPNRAMLTFSLTGSATLSQNSLKSLYLVGNGEGFKASRWLANHGPGGVQPKNAV